MKEKVFIAGYKALERLYANKLPIIDAYKIYSLKTKMRDAYQFQIEQEKKIISEYGGVYDENGALSFPNKLEFSKFRDAILELNDVELDVSIEPIVLIMEQIKDIDISPADIEALEGFVSFE